MKPLTRLIVAIVLFVAWLGWLGYLVVSAAHPIVLSRPQFLISDLDVIAKVEAADGAPNPEVTIDSVYWARASSFRPEGKQQIRVLNLSQVTDTHGWQGPGLYILPLIKEGKDYRVADVPRSPGFEPEVRDAAPRIYPLTPQTRAQLEEIRKAETSTEKP
jgi:hypothetical protein